MRKFFFLLGLLFLVPFLHAQTPGGTTINGIGGPFTFTGGGVSCVGYVCTFSGGGGMVYPGAGVPDSTGSAWGTSYSVAGSGADLTSGPASSVSGDIATFTGTSGQLQDSGTLLSSLAPIASPTFTGTVTAPTFVGSLTGGASLDLPLAGGTLSGNLVISNATAAPQNLLIVGGSAGSWATLTVEEDDNSIVFASQDAFVSNTSWMAIPPSEYTGLGNLGPAPYVYGLGISCAPSVPNSACTGGFIQTSGAGELNFSGASDGTTAGTFNFIGTITASALTITGTPTLAVAAGAGTGAAVSCAASYGCNPNYGTVSLTIGSAPTASSIQFTLTASPAYAAFPSCSVFPVTATTAPALATMQPYAVGTSTSVASFGMVAPVAGTYTLSYRCN